MIMIRGAMTLLGVALGLAIAAGPAWAQERAGEATRTQQNAFQWATFSPDRLATGDEIYRDADVYTTAYGSLELSLDDGSVLTLGPRTELKIDEFVFNPETQDGTSSLSIGRGILRMASGRMKSENVRIGTPTATIGIRGTELVLDANTPGRLQVWSTEGTVTVAPNGTDEVYVLNAPAFADCGAELCEIRDSPVIPYFFPIAPRDPANPYNRVDKTPIFEDDDNISHGSPGNT